MSAEATRVALVSGVTGFIGSHLARGLSGRGWKVHGLVRPASDRAQLVRVAANPTLHELDGSTEQLVRIVDDVSPDAVFHLASLFLASHGVQDVKPLVCSNVLFGAQLLEASVAAGVRGFLNTGTAWQHHENRNEPVNLYAATKQAFEAFLNHRVASSPLRAVTLKLHDTYGLGDRRPKLIAALLEAAETGSKFVMSPGEQRLDLTHVSDVVEAFAVAAERFGSQEEGTHESFAVRSGRGVSLRQLVELLEAAGSAPRVDWGGRPYREREVMRPWSGGTVLPGWSPRVPLEEGLAALVAARSAEGL